MAKFSRDKGAAAEREVVALCRAYGWPDAERSSNGRAQRSRGDIARGPARVSIEVKRGERAEVWKWLEQAAEDAGQSLPVLAFRRSRSTWYACIELEELLPLLALREHA